MDLKRCASLTSAFVGALVDAVVQMRADGKSVVVYVSPEVGRFLNMAHLYHLMSYELGEPLETQRRSDRGPTVRSA